MQPCDRTVAQNFSEIAQDLGFWTQKCTIYHFFTFFWSFFEKIVCFRPILFAQNFQTEILVAQKNFAFRKSDTGNSVNNLTSSIVFVNTENSLNNLTLSRVLGNTENSVNNMILSIVFLNTENRVGNLTLSIV